MDLKKLTSPSAPFLGFIGDVSSGNQSNNPVDNIGLTICRLIQHAYLPDLQHVQ
jgi:hypothetical protein